jgi:hypothetical protein
MMSLAQLKVAINNKTIPAHKLQPGSVNAAIQYMLPFVPMGGATLLQYNLWPAPLLVTFFGTAVLAGKTRVADLVPCVFGGSLGVMGPRSLPVQRATVDEVIWRTCGRLLNVT